MGSILLYGAALPAGADSRAAARVLLTRAVGAVWGWPELPPMARGECGKPYFPERPEKQFNLSHTAGLCLCALSDQGAVGVDIERVRPRRRSLPAYVLSEEEFSAFRASSDETWENFCRLWTLKEAYCKLLGKSIFPPRAVPVPPPVPFRSYAGEGWRAALCAEGSSLPEEITWVEV